MKNRSFDFVQFPKIYESSNDWQPSKSESQKMKKMDFCVTEKAHGANFVFVIEKQKYVTCFKRRGIIEEKEFFFGYKLILKKYTPNLVRLSQNFPDDTNVYVYGEILGGYYPSDSIENKGSIENAVQTGIYYSPNIEFYAFDMAIQKDEKHEFLDYEKTIVFFEKSEIPFANPLFVGKFNKCIQFKLGFDSLIPQIYGLPKILNNKAEGIVVKPLKNFLIKTRKGKLTRPILKLKIKEFSEKIYDQVKKVKVDTFRDISPKEILFFEIDSLVNQNRLNAAISKVGNVKINKIKTMKNIKEVMEDEEVKKEVKAILTEMKTDVLEELISTNEEEWKKCDESEKREIRKKIKEICQKKIVIYIKSVLK